MPDIEMHGERRGPVWAGQPGAVRYRRRRPGLGTILVVLGLPAAVTGFALLMIYGENMALDGLGAFVLCFGGTIAATIGFLMFRRGERLPSFRQDYAEPNVAMRRTLLFHAIGAPLIGLGIAAIPCARAAAVALGGTASGPLAWAIFVAGIVGVFAGGKMLAAKLPGFGDPRTGHAEYEARFSSRIAGWLTAFGVVMIPATLMLAFSSDADPDTRWSVAIVFVAFGIAFAAFGGRLLRDRRVLLRVDERGLFWRKLGTIPWDDVIRTRVRVGRRIRALALTIREPDGASVSFVIDIMGLDRDFRELGAALQKRGVHS